MSISLGALVLVLISSLCWSGFDLTRKLLVERIRPVPLVFLLTALSVPLFAAWTAMEGLPRVPPGYVPPALGSILLNIAANLAYFAALRGSELSVVVPLLSFTPVFTALLAIPLLGEVPSPSQALGILLVVAGAFLLGLAGDRISLGALWRSWRHNRGTGWIVLVALLWSMTVPLDKMASERASGPFHGMVLCAGVATGVLLLLIFQRRVGEVADARRAPGILAVALVISAAALGLQLLAMQQIEVGLMEALKRGIGNALAVVLGRLVFGEAITLRKVGAGALMAGGVALILV